MTLLELINIVKNIAIHQPNIRTSEEGSIYEILNGNPSVKYNAFVITQGTHRQDSQFNYFNFNLFCVDRLVDDLESNRTQAQSMAIEMLSNVINTLNEVYDIEIENELNFTTFTEKFKDECAGAYLQVTLIAEKTLYCMDEYVIDETKPIKIINQTKSITITENGEYNVTFDEGYTGLKEVNIDVEIDIEEQQAIGYQRGYAQGKSEGFQEGIETGYSNGYDVGKTDGYSEGYNIGVEKGFDNAETTISEEAVVLTAKENRTYLTKYTGGEGNLIKQVNVEVEPKVMVRDGLKFGESKYVTIPDYFDFSGVSDVTRMFYRCFSLEQAPLFRTDMVTDFTSMFDNCTNLKSIPFYDTSNVQSFYRTFYTCHSIETIPQFDTSKAVDISEMLGDCYQLKSVPALDASNVENRGYGLFSWSTMENLTDFGGLINLKASIDGWGAFNMTPNLTYESCINILNGLYDFTGNGETPNSNQGRLKVSASFINQLTEEDIQIPIRKGWVIFSD